jgi:hypothetical protein
VRLHALLVCVGQDGLLCTYQLSDHGGGSVGSCMLFGFVGTAQGVLL